MSIDSGCRDEPAKGGKYAYVKHNQDDKDRPKWRLRGTFVFRSRRRAGTLSSVCKIEKSSMPRIVWCMYGCVSHFCRKRVVCACGLQRIFKGQSPPFLVQTKHGDQPKEARPLLRYDDKYTILDPISLHDLKWDTRENGQSTV